MRPSASAAQLALRANCLAIPSPQDVARRLRKRYRNHAHYNRKNPLEELLFILCSTKTQESSYRSTFLALKKKFPTFTKLGRASASHIAKPLVSGGLYRQKSTAIRKIFDEIIHRFGRLTLSPLRGMTDKECEDFLTSLPGVGKKVTRCVMMYSLGRNVFPVDTHCWRVSRRLGWVRATQKDGHCSPRDMDRLQRKIPPRLRFSLHVNFVSLGREFCTAHRPECPRCPLRALCPKLIHHR
jgi:endonuclease III